jgi:transketolase
MSKAIRDVYGEELVKLGRINENIVVLDADVSASTKTSLFKDAYPDRFFNVGIAEANMTAMAAGFAAEGKIPFVNTFAVFLTSLGLAPARAFCSYSKLPVKLMGAYGGLSDSFDGPSHHSLEDIATMRVLPNIKVYVASDAVLTRWLVRHAVSDDSPMYIRLSRSAFPDIYGPDEKFDDGKGKIVRDGKDITVIACGLLVSKALEAAEILAEEDISVRVIDMFCIKPLDTELVLKSALETGAVVTAEEHNVFGGLGGAVSEVLCENNAKVPVGFVGVKDRHSECGPYEKLIKYYGLDADAIVSKIRNVLKQK